MSFWVIIYVSIALFIGISLFFDPDQDTKLKLDKLLSDREKLSDKDFHDRFFADSTIPREVTGKIRHLFSEQLGYDLSALEADDDFSKEFSIIWGLDSMADVEIVISLEEEFNIKITDAEAESMRTMRGVAEIVAAKLHD